MGFFIGFIAAIAVCAAVLGLALAFDSYWEGDL